MGQLNIAVVVGSIRKDSFNRRFAEALARLASAEVKFNFVRIDDLPHYNQDEENSPGPAVERLREEIRAANGVLFVTPEYNRSVPGVLKNAIDIASRPYGHSAFNGKPAAVVSNSPGNIGGFGAHHHLRQTLAFLNMPVLQQPEMYLSGVGDWFDDEGKVKKEETRKFLAQFVQTFANWIEQVAPAKRESAAA